MLNETKINTSMDEMQKFEFEIFIRIITQVKGIYNTYKHTDKFLSFFHYFPDS